MKRSVIWNGLSDRELRELVARSRTISEIVTAFGISSLGGGRHRILRQRLDTLEIDYSHIATGLDHRKGKHFPMAHPPVAEYLGNPPRRKARNQALKKWLIADGILQDVCSICGLGPMWNDKHLVLVLDHINGQKQDWRLDNLRILCPNCHSQTVTFAGRNLRKKQGSHFCQCGKPKTWEATHCQQCYLGLAKKTLLPKLFEKNRRLVIDQEELRRRVWSLPMIHLAAQLGVSAGAIAKRCRRLGIKTPPAGYWSKKVAKAIKD